MLQLLLLLLLTASALALPAGQGFSSRQGPLDQQAWLSGCGDCRVLYLGEEHDRLLDHQIQRDVLESVATGRSPAVIVEMFQDPSRQVLIDYVADVLDDAELRIASEWDKRWGHPWEMYLPIWQLCQQWHIPLLPLRNSSESGKNLSKQGVQAFSAEERQGLAPPPYEFGPHPETLKPVFEAHAGPVSQAAFERFLNVQVLWEEYMATQIRRALRENEGQVVVLVGKGHLTHGFGLAQRVQREWPHPLTQKIVLCNPSPDEQKRADLWWSNTSP